MSSRAKRRRVVEDLSEKSREHIAMKNKVDVHEILRRKAPLDDKME